jgi:hypothetical protein
LLGQQAKAQNEKEIRTRSGTPVILVNLVSSRPDCTSTPGLIAVPIIREKPMNGHVGMQVVATDIAASQNCPSRKVPTVALVYVPNNDFVGADSVQVEIDVGNRTTTLRYRLTVADAAQPL